MKFMVQKQTFICDLRNSCSGKKWKYPKKATSTVEASSRTRMRLDCGYLQGKFLKFAENIDVVNLLIHGCPIDNFDN